MQNIIYVERYYFVTTNDYGFRFFNVIDKKAKIIPFEDVSYLIFDNERTYFSQKLINDAMTNNVGLLFCDQHHSPMTMMMNEYHQNRHLLKLQQQINLSSRTRDRIWRKIVIAKITNQVSCLENVKGRCMTTNLLNSLKSNIKDGDPSNREAYAAKVYFHELFGKDFKRGRFSDITNASLNYGYAILRSLIQRDLVMHGLEPCWGIHHKSVNNYFNLSDDILEPFRSFVDYYVWNHILNDETYESFDLNAKKTLVNILLMKCIIDHKIYTLPDAIDLIIDKFLKCLDMNSAASLSLPVFIEIGE